MGCGPRRWWPGLVLGWSLGLVVWGCVVACLSRCVGFVPVVSVALRSARCRVAPWGGAALGFSFRRSRRSLSGFVAVARFGSFAAASRFAWSWGRRLPARPGFCAVRSPTAAAATGKRQRPAPTRPADATTEPRAEEAHAAR